MGTILGSRTKKDGSVIFEVEIDYEESLQLKGHIKNVHVFSEDIPNVHAKLTARGKNESTKYFLIPKELRKGLKLKDNQVKCQKVETPTKIMFVYVVDKLKI